VYASIAIWTYGDGYKGRTSNPLSPQQERKCNMPYSYENNPMDDSDLDDMEEYERDCLRSEIEAEMQSYYEYQKDIADARREEADDREV
jgi:hypothetical protein